MRNGPACVAVAHSEATGALSQVVDPGAIASSWDTAEEPAARENRKDGVE